MINSQSNKGCVLCIFLILSAIYFYYITDISVKTNTEDISLLQIPIMILLKFQYVDIFTSCLIMA